MKVILFSLSSKRIIKRYERASAKMEEMHQQEEVMREQMELARLQEENSRQRKAEEEHQRMKKKAELWHTGCFLLLTTIHLVKVPFHFSMLQLTHQHTYL